MEEKLLEKLDTIGRVLSTMNERIDSLERPDSSAVRKIDERDVRELLVRTARIEELLKDKEARLRHLEASQNKWFGSKTIIVAIGSIIITLLLRLAGGWFLEHNKHVELKALPIEKRELKFSPEPKILD